MQHLYVKMQGRVARTYQEMAKTHQHRGASGSLQYPPLQLYPRLNWAERHVFSGTKWAEWVRLIRALLRSNRPCLRVTSSLTSELFCPGEHAKFIAPANRKSWGHTDKTDHKLQGVWIDMPSDEDHHQELLSRCIRFVITLVRDCVWNRGSLS